MDPLQFFGVDTEFVNSIDLSGLPSAIAIVIFAIIVLRVSAQSLDTLGERLTERRLLFKQISVLTRFSVILITSLLVINALFDFSAEDDNRALYGIVGLVVLAVGYATKDVLSSVTAGFILMFDRPFQVGDRISFGGHYGEVKEIGLRTVRIVDMDDNLISIPNSRFLGESVSCANAGALDQMCVFSFFIGCNENFEAAKRIVYEATASSRYVYLGKPITIVVREGPVPNGAERFAIMIRVKAYVFDGRYETAFGTDITERVKRAFREEGVRTAGEIEWGPPGSGPAPEPATTSAPASAK
ncbi:MAG: mechanosensitive ion channel domain-containing protein [Myxococcota bacterium]